MNSSTTRFATLSSASFSPTILDASSIANAPISPRSALAAESRSAVSVAFEDSASRSASLAAALFLIL